MPRPSKANKSAAGATPPKRRSARKALSAEDAHALRESDEKAAAEAKQRRSETAKKRKRATKPVSAPGHESSSSSSSDSSAVSTVEAPKATAASVEAPKAKTAAEAVSQPPALPPQPVVSGSDKDEKHPLVAPSSSSSSASADVAPPPASVPMSDAEPQVSPAMLAEMESFAGLFGSVLAGKEYTFANGDVVVTTPAVALALDRATRAVLDGTLPPKIKAQKAPKVTSESRARAVELYGSDDVVNTLLFQNGFTKKLIDTANEEDEQFQEKAAARLAVTRLMKFWMHENYKKSGAFSDGLIAFLQHSMVKLFTDSLGVMASEECKTLQLRHVRTAFYQSDLVSYEYRNAILPVLLSVAPDEFNPRPVTKDLTAFHAADQQGDSSDDVRRQKRFKPSSDEWSKEKDADETTDMANLRRFVFDEIQSKINKEKTPVSRITDNALMRMAVLAGAVRVSKKICVDARFVYAILARVILHKAQSIAHGKQVHVMTSETLDIALGKSRVYGAVAPLIRKKAGEQAPAESEKPAVAQEEAAEEDLAEKADS